MRTHVVDVMWCRRILPRASANLATFGGVKALGTVAMLAACNFQSTRAPEQGVDASGGGPASDAAVDGRPDGPVIPPDMQSCFGVGVVKVCLAVLPSGP